MWESEHLREAAAQALQSKPLQAQAAL